jgi:hypothetical protein
MTGLTPIVSLSMLCGVLVTSNIASLMHANDMRHKAAIAEANLVQAERKWMACHNDGVYTVGTDIYLSKVRKSEMTTAQVYEVSGL